MRKDNPRKDDKSKFEKGFKAGGERFNKGSSNLGLPKWYLTIREAYTQNVGAALNWKHHFFSLGN